MVQETTSSKKYGRIVGAYQFFFIFFGCLAVLGFGTVLNILKGHNNGVLIGKLFAIVHSIAYPGAIFSFWMTGKHYAAMKAGKTFNLFGNK